MKKISIPLYKYFFTPSTPINLAFARMAVSIFALFYLTDNNHPDFPEGSIYQEWFPYGVFKYLPKLIETKKEYDIILVLFKSSLYLTFFGIGSRVTTLLSFIFGFIIHGHFLNYSNEVYHHSHMLIMALGILSLGPTHDALSFDRLTWRRGQKIVMDSAYTYPLSLLSIWVILVYTTAGMQKLYHGEGLRWALSQNLRVILLMTPKITSFGEYLMQQNDFVIQTFALCALLVELLSPLALFNRKIFIFFIPMWSTLHIMVKLIFGGHTAFFSYIGAYLALIPFLIRPNGKYKHTDKII